MKTDLRDQIGELIERGARPVSLREISARHAAAGSAIRRERRAGRRRVVIGGVAAGVAAAGCAAVLIIVPAHPGGPAHPGRPARQDATFLTVAMVQHLAAASRSALANSGQEQVSYRSVRNGVVTSSGTDTVTYSGSNWNSTLHQTVPGSLDGAVRVVNGQFYVTDSTAVKPTWLREPAEGNLSLHFPKAATLLRLLSPAANFQNAGTDVIGGVRLTHLHATRVSGLPDDPTLARYANLVSTPLTAPSVPPGILTALDLWADSRGVVHRMTIQMHGGDGQTTLTVTFSQFGQPEVITAPPPNEIP